MRRRVTASPGKAPAGKLTGLIRVAGTVLLAGAVLGIAALLPGETAAAEAPAVSEASPPDRSGIPIPDSKAEPSDPNPAGIPISDPEAEVLDLDAAGITITDPETVAAMIERMPRVKEIRMYDSPMVTADMETLFDRYSPEIFFGFTVKIGPHEIRTDRTAFSTLHLAGRMQGDERHTSEELYPIRMCTKMKALDLGHNTLTDLRFLQWMPELEVLIISPNYGLTDISPVANCKKLVYLECFNTPITDLSPLAELTELRDLNLTRDSQVRDLSPLYELPNLERVWWGHMNGVSADQKKILRQTHRGCKFVSVYDPTGGGWRNHSHFRELHDFFRTGEYIPFSK